jgi:hypothetical protein
MTEAELLDLHIAAVKSRHARALYACPQYIKENQNNHWKLPMNLGTFKDMGRMDLFKRETDRQLAIKAADKKCFTLHGRYMTQEEFESGTFK